MPITQLAGLPPTETIIIEPLKVSNIESIPLGTMVFIYGPNDLDLRFWSYTFCNSHPNGYSCFISLTCPVWTLLNFDNISKKLQTLFGNKRFWIIDCYTGLYSLEETASLRGWELEETRQSIKKCSDIFTLYKRIREFSEEVDRKCGGAENYFDIFGKFYYSFDYGNSLFIVLDDANETRIDAVQMKWLEEQLQKNYQHKFVFLHVPPFDPRSENGHSLGDKENAKYFMDLMEKYKVDIVFASHIHAYFDEMRNGINYVITSGAGSELWGTDPNHYFNHYVKVEINGGKISKEVIRFPSVDYN